MTKFDKSRTEKENFFDADHVRKNLRERAVRGAGVVVTAKMVTYSVQMIGTIILARLLTPEDFGLVAMVSVLSALFVEFGGIRLTDATIQKEKLTHNQVSTLLWINVTLCAVILVIFVSLAPVMAWFYGEARLKSIANALAIGFVFHGVSVQHLALLQRNMQFHRFAGNQIAATMFSVIVAVSFAVKGFGYWAIVARQLSLGLARAVGAWLLCSWRPGRPKFNSGIRGMLVFGINSLGNYITAYLSRSVDKVLIGWRYGSEALGYYDRAYHLFVMPVNQLSYPLTGVAVSTLSKLVNQPEKFRKYYLKAISVIAFIGMGLSVIVTISGTDVILLLLGPQWKKAGLMLSLFGPGIGVFLIYGTHGWIHLSVGRADRWFRWGIISSSITVLFFIGGLRYGAKGVAVGYTMSFYALILPGLWYAGRPVDLQLRAILSIVWGYFGSSVVTAILCWYLMNSVEVLAAFLGELHVAVRIVISSTLCLLVYLSFVVAFHRSLNPIKQLLSILLDMIPEKKGETGDKMKNRESGL